MCSAIYVQRCICMEPPAPSLLPSLPACSPCSQIAPLIFSLLPLPPWASLGPGTSLRPQEAPSSLTACSPCSLSIPGSLELPSLQPASLLPALCSLPAPSHLLPAGSQWPMNSLVCIGVHTTSGWQGASGQAGSKLEWGEQAGSEYHIHVALYTRGAIYVWCHIHVAPYMHGTIYECSNICMEPYMHGAVYLWHQLTSLAPWAYLGPWNFPGALVSPQLTPLASSSLPLLPACSPYSLSICGPLGPPWGLRKFPAHSPCSQLAPLAPLSISRPFDLPKASGSPQFTHSLLPLLPEHPWVPRTSLSPASQLAVACSQLSAASQLPPAHSQLAPNGQWIV